MNGQEIAERLREWAKEISAWYWTPEDMSIASKIRIELRALASRLEAEPACSTLAKLVTPEQAGLILDRICLDMWQSDVERAMGCAQCDRRVQIRDGQEPQESKPSTSAKLCAELYRLAMLARAKEAK